MLMRDYDVDGLRFDDTVDIRTYNTPSGRHTNQEGVQLLREINSSYRSGNGERRLPNLIDGGNTDSVFAKKRSTLAAVLLLTAPGIPMLFQGQEMLDNRDLLFKTASNVDFKRVKDLKYSGIVQMYRDLIALRRNAGGGGTRGLTGQQLNVFHQDDG